MSQISHITREWKKIKSEGNSIHSLYDKNGVLHSNTEKVSGIATEYSSNLFQAGKTNKRLQKEIMSKTKVKINPDQKEFYDKELDLNELEEGMKYLPVDKTPGLDGLPVEFYQQMWPVVKSDFLEMVREVQKQNILSDSQRKGAISLIFEKEDRSDLKFCRPISLLNVDVKIITKTLALRLGKILPHIISQDQTCIPGRNIATNLHTLSDVIKYANSRNIEAAVLFLDQEQTFDKVDHFRLLDI